MPLLLFGTREFWSRAKGPWKGSRGHVDLPPCAVSTKWNHWVPQAQQILVGTSDCEYLSCTGLVAHLLLTLLWPSAVVAMMFLQSPLFVAKPLHRPKACPLLGRAPN